jgi:hypothetical protein
MTFQSLHSSPSPGCWDILQTNIVSILGVLKYLTSWLRLHRQGTEAPHRLNLSPPSGHWDILQTPFVPILIYSDILQTPSVSNIRALRYPTDSLCLQHPGTEISYRLPLSHPQVLRYPTDSFFLQRQTTEISYRILLSPPSGYWDILQTPFVSTISVVRYPTDSLFLQYQSTEISYRLPFSPPSG